MPGRGRPPLPLCLLLLLCGPRAAQGSTLAHVMTPGLEDTSPLLETTPPVSEVTSLLVDSTPPVSENVRSTENTSPIPRVSTENMMSPGNTSPLRNSTVLATTIQSAFKESMGVTASSTPGTVNHTDTASTLLSSTTYTLNNTKSSRTVPTTATPHTSDVMDQSTTPHILTTTAAMVDDTLTSADMMTSLVINGTEHTTSITDKAGTMQVSSVSVNVTALPETTTHSTHTPTNSPSSITGFTVISTEHPIVSSTLEIVTTHTAKSTANVSSRTEYSVTSTSGTFSSGSVIRSTGNDLQNGSSVSVTKSSLTVEPGTSSNNETTRGLELFTTRDASLSPSLVPSTVDHTEGSSNITTTSGVQGSTATDSNPCRNIACPPFSVCIATFSSYTCTCPPGFYFDPPANCLAGRIFPGVLHLNTRKYTEDMDNDNSIAFRQIVLEIENILNIILKNETGYVRSAVTKLSRGSVVAAVENIYQPFATVTSKEIANAVCSFIERCTECGPLKKGDQFNEQDICSLNTCDNTTTICRSSSGTFTCTCKDGFFKHVPTDQSCAACASGFKLENKLCVKCPFGYAGFNCDDSSLLAVVVISCVLGSLLVILLTSLLITCYRSKEARKESYEQETYLMWPKQEVPKIPRVTMNRDSSQIDYGSKNILMDNELSNGNTINPQITRVEDMKTFTNTNPTRYSYLRQGQANPYFVNEEASK